MEVILSSLLLLVLIQTLQVQGQVGIKFSPTIPNGQLTKKVSESFYVSCELTDETPSKQDAVFKWFDKTGAEVTTTMAVSGVNPYVRTGAGWLKLGFRELIEDDAGKYTCKATVNNEEYEKSFQLLIEASLVFRNCDENQNGLIGTSHDITCIASADGLDVTVEWEFKSSQILPDVKKYALSNQALKVLNVSQEDEGTYTYIATIKGRSETDLRNIEFRAVEIPRFNSPEQEKTAVKGNKVELFCEATGRPRPSKIEWRREGETLEIVGTDRIIVSTGVVSDTTVQKKLTINNVIREDQGKYICTAYGERVSGQDLTATHSTNLIVQIPPTVTLNTPPKGTEGTGALISCVAYGEPEPTMTWQIEGTSKEYFQGVFEENRIHVTRSSKKLPDNTMVQFNISFTKVLRKDAGVYVCKALSKAGNDLKKAEFVVEYGPKFVEAPAKFYTWSPVKPALETETKLTCKTDSNPQPVYEWYKDNKLILDSMPFYGMSTEKDPQNVHISTNTLTVQFNGGNTDVIGMYKCKAKNHVNSSEIQMELAKAEVPPKPTVQVKSTIATEIIFLLEVGTSNGPPVERFSVEYTKDGDPSEVLTQEVARETRPEIDLERRYTQMTVQNLKENTAYSFTFYSISPAGRSFGEEFKTTTPPVRKPDVVHILTDFDDASPTIIQVRWLEPITGGSPITKYTLKYQEVSVKPDNGDRTKGYELLSPIGVEQTIDNIALEQYELKGLIPNRYYLINVFAHNIKGPGAPGSKIIKTADGPNPYPVSGASRQVVTNVTIVGCLAALCACLKSFV